MKIFLILMTIIFSALSHADQIVINSKNLKSFSFEERNFRPKGDGSAASDFQWYEDATVTINLNSGDPIKFNFSFPGPRTYQSKKSSIMKNLNIIKSDITSFMKLDKSIVCYKLIAFADAAANSLEFHEQVVPCPAH